MNMKFDSITSWCMMLCVGAFCAGLFAFNPAGLYLWPIASGQFDIWQLVTYSFFHGGIIHLLVNMFGLWQFGPVVENTLGEKRYILILIGGSIVGAVFQLLYCAMSGSIVPTVGFSAALSAVFGAYAIANPNQTIMLLIPPIPMKVRTMSYWFVAVSLALGIYNLMGGGGSTAHFAHLGGFFFGAGYLWFTLNRIKKNRKSPPLNRSIF